MRTGRRRNRRNLLIMHHIPYPEGTTLQESFLCCNCPFKDEYLHCQRLQEHKDSYLILKSRRRNNNE